MLDDDHEIELPEGATSLDFLQAIYRDPAQPISRRMKAAGMALPFERPKLSAIAVGTANDLADRQMQALQASAKVINARPTALIEHSPKAEAGLSADEVPDHSGPFTRLRRF